MFPKIGEAVKVTLRSDNGKLVGAKNIFSKVKQVYMDGQVQVTSGDQWEVRKSNNLWVTCK